MGRYSGNLFCQTRIDIEPAVDCAASEEVGMGITSWPCEENAFAPLSGVLSCATNGQGSAVVRWELMGRDRLERRNTFLVIEAMGSMEGMVYVD